MLKHGKSRTKLYQTWADMKTRCLCKNNPFYYRYGGRGITICDEWLDFIPFYEWAIKSGYRPDLTIDRIDNNKGYSPENCKWSTQQEQSLNKSHLPNKTGFVGVKRHGRGYSAEVARNNRLYYVGTFDTAIEASKAREVYIREHFQDSRGFQATSGEA